MEKKNKKQTAARRKPTQQPVKKAPQAHPRKNPPVKEEPVRVTPEVVYLAPKPFSRSRLILRLATIVAVVLALVLGLSIFFKVGKIEVSGCSQYTAWQVQQASGIREGDQLLSFSRASASGKIIAALPYVKTVRIGITLPDTVKIEIVETRVTYALEDRNGNWWLMDSDGKIIEQLSAESEVDHTVITGVKLDNAAAGEQASAWQPSEPQYDDEGNEIPVTVTAAQRLTAVIDLADYLEQNGIIGEVASIDVTSLFDIKLWYGEKFDVSLGDTSQLNLKVRYLKSFVDDYTVNRPYEAGELDLSDPGYIEYRSFGSEE